MPAGGRQQAGAGLVLTVPTLSLGIGLGCTPSSRMPGREAPSVRARATRSPSLASADPCVGHGSGTPTLRAGRLTPCLRLGRVTWKPLRDELPAVLRHAAEAHDLVYILGIQEEPLPESWSLIFQECPGASEEDESRGWDTYWIGVGYGQGGCYGEVIECELTPSRQPTLPMMPPNDMTDLRLVFTDQTASDLRLPTEVRFTLRLSDQQLQIVKRGLVRVLTSGRPSSHPRLIRV